VFVSIDFCGSFWGEISFQSPETNNIFFCVFFEGKSKNGSWIRYSHSQPLGPESRNAPRPHAPSSCEGLRLWITLFTVPYFSQIPSTASRSSALRYGGHLGFICTESSWVWVPNVPLAPWCRPIWCHLYIHPRRPRGSQSGRDTRRGECFSRRSGAHNIMDSCESFSWPNWLPLSLWGCYTF